MTVNPLQSSQKLALENMEMGDTYNSTQSKSMEAYHGFAPKKIYRAKGPYLFDCDNNKFLDCGMALGSVSLGYAYDVVDDYVIEVIKKGINFSRPSYLEEELTLLLNKKLGFPLLAKFCKSSSMLLSVIPRVSRYLTGKTHIAYPFNGSYLGNTDWFFSQSKTSGGILDSIRTHTITFKGGDVDSLMELFEKNAHQLACIIMEPFREKKI